MLSLRFAAVKPRPLRSLQKPFSYAILKNMKSVNLYTDGACSGNQNETNIGGWGCVLEYGPHIKELHGGQPDTTNNRMELTALIEALSALKEKGLRLRIFSDSSYLINCFKNRWYVKWKANGWKTSGRAPVENRDLWEQLLGLLDGNDAEFYLIKGHLDPVGDSPKMKKAYEKFCSHNGNGFSYEEFIRISEFNCRCDELANVFIGEYREQQ